MKLIIKIVFLIFFVLGSAQDKKLSRTEIKNLNIDLKTYEKHTVSKDYSNLIKYILPDLVRLTGEDYMIEQFEKLNTNPKTEFKSLVFQIPEKCWDNDNIKVCKIPYQTNFEMIFKKQDSQSEAEFDNYLKTMTGIYKNGEFKDSEVFLNLDKSSIDIKSSKVILGIRKPKYNTWKFIEYNPKMKFIYEKSIGKPYTETIINSK